MKKTGNGSSKVVSLVDRRVKKTSDDRRKAERFLLREFIQVFCVFERVNLVAVELLEASSTGCAFRVPYESIEKFTQDSHFQMRVYLSKDSYLLIGMKVVNQAPMLEGGRKFVRFGCEVDQSFSSYPAYRQLMQFIDEFAKVSKIESGGFNEVG